jgi:hypothetical protein
MLRLLTYRTESELGKCHPNLAFGDLADLKMVENQQITSPNNPKVWIQGAKSQVGDSDR